MTLMARTANLRPPIDLADSETASRVIHWTLRLGVWACFVGHGMFGIRQKAEWLTFFEPFGVPPSLALPVMSLVGFIDITLGYLALLYPRRVVFMYTAAWGVFTALLRPLVGLSFLETLERAGNYGPSFALLLGTAGAALLYRPRVYGIADQAQFDRLKQVLALTTCLLLVGHGGLALGGKPLLVEHWRTLGFLTNAEQVTRTVGGIEILAATLVLVRPTRFLAAAIVIWKLATEMLFLNAGAPVWEVVERGGSYFAPLALFVMLSHRAALRHRIVLVDAEASGHGVRVSPLSRKHA